MAHANATTGASIYVAEGMPGPDDSAFDFDGWPGPVRYVGPGASIVVDIDDGMDVGGGG